MSKPLGYGGRAGSVSGEALVLQERRLAPDERLEHHELGVAVIPERAGLRHHRAAAGGEEQGLFVVARAHRLGRSLSRRIKINNQQKTGCPEGQPAMYVT